ncbi:MAG: RNA polymerase factor sigma-54 [Acidobacteriota bacterium]|nr:RNA polymerase factor sigma-54 [Acidobacteriota bacterium]
MNKPQARLGLNLRVAQKQILTPGLVQMVTVLALNKLELRDMINQEMVENPVLEEITDAVPEQEEVQKKNEESAETEPAGEAPASGDDDRDAFNEVDYGSFFNDYLDPGYKSPAAEDTDKPSFENFLSRPTSLAEHLQWQVNLSTCRDAVRDAAYSVIGNLNEDGYLTATLEELVEAGGHELKDVEEALALVQELDPAGVGARDLRECLLIQLRMTGAESPLAVAMVSDHLGDVEAKQHRRIASALGCSVEEVEECLEAIRRLDPRPGQRYNNTEPRLIEPDVAFVKVDDGYRVMMNEEGLPQLRLSHHYRRLLSDGSATGEVRKYVRERFNSALQLIKNIEQRKQTIVKVCEAIIRRQTEFLDRGLDYLRPMMIKEVAEEVGVHPSTVSRAVSSKYVHTPQGVFELRYFFSEAVQGPSGASTSLVILKRTVAKMIEQEDAAHPLTDDHIAQLLHTNGINVTRRTVAKYREDMKIPSTHQRRKKA